MKNSRQLWFALAHMMQYYYQILTLPTMHFNPDDKLLIEWKWRGNEMFTPPVLESQIKFNWKRCKTSLNCRTAKLSHQHEKFMSPLMSSRHRAILSIKPCDNVNQQQINFHVETGSSQSLRKVVPEKTEIVGSGREKRPQTLSWRIGAHPNKRGAKNWNVENF